MTISRLDYAIAICIYSYYVLHIHLDLRAETPIPGPAMQRPAFAAIRIVRIC